VECTIEVVDDGNREKTFFIKDRDGIDKTLVVDESNRDLAYDSWIQAWEEQKSG